MGRQDHHRRAGGAGRRLAEHGVALVAMEATGVYWKPVYYALEDRFELWLATPIARELLDGQTGLGLR
ncbi:MAG TPA: hypothetical protein VIX86_10480 [Streptosporangiaceae bacterium]